MMIHRTLHRRGFTLLEITIVLGVIGVLVAALWATANKVYANHRLGVAVEQINAIVDKIRGFYLNIDADVIASERRLACPGSTPTTPCEMSAFLGAKPNSNFYPPEVARVVAGRTLPFNPWNAEYEVWFMNDRGDTILIVEGLNSGSCADLISRLPVVGINNGTTFDAGGNIVTAATAPTVVTSFVLGANQAARARASNNLQNGQPTHVYFHNGTNWRDVTALAPEQIAVVAAFDTCQAVAFYYML